MKYAGVVISSIFAIVMFATNGFLAPRIGANTATAVDFAAAPQGWAFSIWGIIYFFQAAWIIYTWVINCQSPPADATNDFAYSSNNKSADDQSSLFPFRFHVLYALACIFNATWVFIVALTNPLLLVNNVIPFFMIVALAVCLGFCLSIALDTNEGNQSAIYKVLVLNGFALYVPWVGLVAPSVSIGSMVHQFAKMPDPGVSYFTLSLIFAGAMMIWFFEFGVYPDRYRSLFAHYFTLMNGIAGILTKGIALSNGPSIFAVVLFALVVVVFLAKIGSACVSGCRSDEQSGNSRGFQAV